MSQWTEKKKEISEALKGTKARSYSKQDLTDLTHALLNSPEEELSTYVKSENGYTEVKSNPSKDFRDALKKVAKDVLDIDNAEADKLDTAQFSKPLASAVNDIAAHAIKASLDVGRKYPLLMTSPDESQMGISIGTAAERKTESVQFVKNEDGTTTKVPTGKWVTTKEHKTIVSHNKVPAWLKKTE